MKEKGHDLRVERVDGDNFDEFLDLIVELAAYERLSPPDAEARARRMNWLFYRFSRDVIDRYREVASPVGPPGRP